MTVFGGYTKVRPYATISLDCSAAATDSAQGAVTILGTSTTNWIANTITFISLAGNTVTFKLDDSDAGSITASDGLTVTGIPFSEIYWTITAGAGNAEVILAWVD